MSWTRSRAGVALLLVDAAAYVAGRALGAAIVVGARIIHGRH